MSGARVARLLARQSLRRQSNISFATRHITPAVSPVCRSFHVSVPRLGTGQKDQPLVDALKSELEFEVKNENAKEVPEFLQSLRDEGVWELTDKPGSDVVQLSRKFGNETINVTWRISDWSSVDESELDQEAFEVEGEGEEDGAALESDPRIPFTITITKSKAPGAMFIEADAMPDSVEVQNVAVFGDKSMAEREGAEGDYLRNESYAGPNYSELDPELQDAFHAYVDERLNNEKLGSFMHSYSEHKEQTDYVNWLENVGGFVKI